MVSSWKRKFCLSKSDESITTSDEEHEDQKSRPFSMAKCTRKQKMMMAMSIHFWSLRAARIGIFFKKKRKSVSVVIKSKTST